MNMVSRSLHIYIYIHVYKHMYNHIGVNSKAPKNPEEGHRETSTKRVLNIRERKRERESGGAWTLRKVRIQVPQFSLPFCATIAVKKNILPVIFHLKVSDSKYKILIDLSLFAFSLFVLLYCNFFKTRFSSTERILRDSNYLFPKVISLVEKRRRF